MNNQSRVDLGLDMALTGFAEITLSIDHKDCNIDEKIRIMNENKAIMKDMIYALMKVSAEKAISPSLN